MLTIFITIVALAVVFVVLGLLGWLGQGLNFIVELLGKGISGCLGCCLSYIWYILVIGVFIAVAIQLL